MTCEQRCKSLHREVPSYSTIENVEPSSLYNQCVNLNNETDCSFPINVKYSFEKKLWIGKNYLKTLYETDHIKLRFRRKHKTRV